MACDYCGVHSGVNVNLKWVVTTAIHRSSVTRHLRDCHGIIVPAGFGVRGTEDQSEGIRYAREDQNLPIMQILDLSPETHPYFIGTQAHPELTSRPLRPQPMFMGLIRAAMTYAEAKEKQQTQAV